jgi:hypothetical protein
VKCDLLQDLIDRSIKQPLNGAPNRCHTPTYQVGAMVLRAIAVALGGLAIMPALAVQGNDGDGFKPDTDRAIALSEQSPPVAEGQLEDTELGQIKLRPHPLSSPAALPPENSSPQATPAIESGALAPQVQEVASPARPIDRSVPETLDPTKPLPLDSLKPLIPDDDPELGKIQPRPPLSEDELGKILIRPKPKPVAAAKSKSVYLLAHANYFTTANAFSAKDRVADGLTRSGLTLFYAPALGPSTYLITSADANVVRYNKLPELNYNELRFRAGISQRLAPTMFAELGWSNQQLFATERGFSGTFRGKRYLNDNSLRFELSRRDTLAPKLSLLTFYQLRRSFTDRSDSDRLSNTLYASLTYKATPRLDLALDYQYNRSDYILRDRRDHFHQVLGRLSWNTAKQLQTNLFAGYSFGSSSDDRQLFGRSGNQMIDFNGWTLGINLVLNVPLF